MPCVKDNDTLAQTFDPNVFPFRPVMPEEFVAYYESYIPVACEGFPDREKAAFEALAARDLYLVERAIWGEPDNRNWLKARLIMHDLGLLP